MIDFLTLANTSKAQLVADRRWLHQHPEIRDDLPMTAQYVMDRLRSMGLEPREISKCGITADIRGGKKGRSVLLRADMDALPVKEDSGLPFASTTGYGHCCGHDLHTAMLLTAASMLSAHKDDLHGCVRLMFQPGEEFGIGSQPMIDAGILEGMEAAVDMHVNARNPVGTVAICPGYTCASSDSMKMTITGKGCHGAWPHLGIDPINAGVHVFLAMQTLIARETPPDQTASFTFGQFSGGTTFNVIPDQVVLQGTMRTFDPNLRKHLRSRLHEIAEHTAAAFGTTLTYEVLNDIPAMYTDPALLEFMKQSVTELGLTLLPYPPSSASDDFSRVTEKIPSVFFSLGCRPAGDGPLYPAHNPKIVFNEDALPLGAALHAQCAWNFTASSVTPGNS